MAGSLRPSTVKEEANYIYLDGRLSAGYYNASGSLLFNQTTTKSNGNNEGPYETLFRKGSYVILDIKDYANIYANIAFANNPKNAKAPNYIETGKLQILKYNGTDYTIDVTDKYWVGRRFIFAADGKATVNSHNLTFEEFLSTELIDEEWQKIVEWLPPGQYKFVNANFERKDNEWFLEKVVPYSKTIKSGVVNTIKNHEMIQKHIPFRIQS